MRGDNKSENISSLKLPTIDNEMSLPLLSKTSKQFFSARDPFHTEKNS